MLKRPLCLVCILLMGVIGCLRLFGAEALFLKPAVWRGSVREGEMVVVSGKLTENRETENGFCLRLAEARLQEGNRPIGDLYVYIKEDAGIAFGSMVIVSGKLSPVEGARNPGEFDRAWYYACDRIYYQMFEARILDHSLEYDTLKEGMSALRRRLCEIFSRRGEEGAVLAAMLLGDKSGLTRETRIRYQMAGIIAILAISGLHISVIGMGLDQALEKAGLGPVPAFLLSFMVLFFYLILTGESVSAIRAVSMFMLNRMAFFLGRSYDLYTALAVPAIWILLQAPACLFSGGFLLSFTAVAGIAAVVPACERFLELPSKTGKKGIRAGLQAKGIGLLKGAAASAGVVLTTMPISLYFYGEVSLIGIPVNMLLLPTVGLVMGSGILGAFLELIGLSTWADASFIPAEGLLKLYDEISAWAARFPGGVWICKSPSLFRCAIFYLFLFGFCLLEKGGEGRKRLPYQQKIEKQIRLLGCSGFPLPKERILKKGTACVLLAGCFLVMGFYPQKTLEMTVLDVGQGDGIVVKTPSKAAFLIDGGSSTQAEVGRYRILPFLKHEGIGRLEGVIITHTDSDHYSGIKEILEMIWEGETALKIKRVFLPDWKETGEEWEELAELAVKAGAEVVRMHRGDRLEAGEAVFTCLWPAAGLGAEDPNEGCIVLKLEYGSFDALLTGDAGMETETKILGDLSRMNVLKVGHHGSRSSTGCPLLERVQPEISVVSCARVNRYGHPAPETIQRLKASGTKVWYTMENGALTFRIDRDTMKVLPYRAVDKPGGNG